MQVSLYLAPGNRHTLRFAEIELTEIARLMQAVSYHHEVQVRDYQRNVLGTRETGELRDAARELARLTRSSGWLPPPADPSQE